MTLTWQHAALGAAVLGVGWLAWRDWEAYGERGGAGRIVSAGAVRPRTHAVRYPHTPGEEIQRLMNGAPGAYACAVPRPLRGWLFAPPAEEDY